MNDITLVQIFFIITGIAVLVVSILLTVLIIYVISFIRTVKQIASTANRAAELISVDASELRDKIKTQGFSLAALFEFIKALLKLKNIKKK